MSLVSRIQEALTAIANQFNATDLAVQVAKTTLLVYTYPGTLVANTTGPRIPIPSYGMEISNVIVQVRVAPTGASVIVDINKNGSTIFTTGKPTIAVSTTQDLTSAPTTNPHICVSGDYITVDIDQIGSTIAGSDLVVIIEGISG